MFKTQFPTYFDSQSKRGIRREKLKHDRKSNCHAKHKEDNTKKRQNKESKDAKYNTKK